MCDRVLLHALRPLVNLAHFKATPTKRRIWLAQRLQRPARRAPMVISAAGKTLGPTSLQNGTWTGSPDQEAALRQLKEAMKATPYAQRVEEDQLRWFLLDRKLDAAEACEKLVRMMQWRDQLDADNIRTTDIAKEAATGKAYLHTHLDVMRRPVLVIRAQKHVIGASPLIESQRLCVHLLDRGMQKLPPDQETMLGVFDLRGFSSRNADLNFVRFMIDAFFTYYPKRVSQILFVEAPWVFGPLYEVIKPWLRKYAALVRFVSVEEVRKEYFTPETIPEDFLPGTFPKGRAS